MSKFTTGPKGTYVGSPCSYVVRGITTACVMLWVYWTAPFPVFVSLGLLSVSVETMVYIQFRDTCRIEALENPGVRLVQTEGKVIHDRRRTDRPRDGR